MLVLKSQKQYEKVYSGLQMFTAVKKAGQIEQCILILFFYTIEKELQL